jgi:hypothetical protein
MHTVIRVAASTLEHGIGKLSFFGATAVGRQTVTLGNTNSEISGLTISAAYSQSEVQALRDKCEELADDVRAIHLALQTYGLLT